MTQRIFVAGATGVIGSRLVPLLAAAGHDVTAVGRTAEKRARLERTGAHAIGVDLFDRAATTQAMKGIEVAINVATHIPPSARAFVPGAWRHNERVRRHVSANLVAAALAVGATRVIQESFAPIYRDAGDDWIEEDAPVRAARYNRAVLDAEAAAERFTREGGTGVVLRFAYFYGADSDFTRDAIRYVRRGRAPVLGSPSAYISSITLDDAARAVVAALDVPAGCYNVSDDRPVRRREFVDALAAALGAAPPKFYPVWVAALAGSLGETLARSQRISNARLRAAANWAPRYPSVAEGWPAVVAELFQRSASPNGKALRPARPRVSSRRRSARTPAGSRAGRASRAATSNRRSTPPL
jgi:nucleoside-diphosphate-sugar epimerase